MLYQQNAQQRTLALREELEAEKLSNPFYLTLKA